MSCFWDSILAKMPRDALQTVCGDTQKMTPVHLIRGFQRMLREGRSACGPDTTWQGQKITEKMRAEMHEWMRDYETSRFNRGTDTSTCNPWFLFLVTHFDVDIVHHFMGVKLVYSRQPQRQEGHPVVLTFRSNRGHIS